MPIFVMTVYETISTSYPECVPYRGASMQVSKEGIMPEKIDYYRSYGQKLISLFAKLLFTQRSHSLIELSRMLNCSKQTVMRLVDDIRRSYGVDVE